MYRKIFFTNEYYKMKESQYYVQYISELIGTFKGVGGLV